MGLAGNWMHGTHVAGIAMAGNPYARLVTARIEFDWHLLPDPCPSRELVERDARNQQAYVDFFKRHGVRVVNMSWGGSVKGIEEQLELCNIGKTPDERKKIARDYFEIQKAALTKAFASAPAILFVTAAGNSNEDASFAEDIPAGIVLPNLMTVGAVDRAGDEASFTSYGPTVVVHANGYQVESMIPGGDKLAESGTSMASPQVANLAAKILAVNPKLTPPEVIKLIRDTADKTPDGRRTLVNPKKALQKSCRRRNEVPGAARRHFAGSSRLRRHFRGQGDGKLLRPRFERRHDRRVERDAVRALLAMKCKRALARQAHARSAGARRRVVAGLDQPVHLRLERIGAAERRGIEHLHEHRRTPAFLWIGAAAPREPAVSASTSNAQPEPLVTGFEPAERQQRAFRFAEQHGRIARGIALRILHPWVRERFAGLV